ncbi:MAG: AAA family ATPase [Candidatus Tectimicrobiota bacterium]
MYLNFYALTQAPFHLTPDPQFLFLSPTHQAALGVMVYGIQARQGMVAIFGEPGVGKTMLVRAYLASVNPQELQTIFVFDASLAFDDLLRLLARELRLSEPSAMPHVLLPAIQQALTDVYYTGRNVALIIDEAQTLPVDTLSHLRLLADLEVEGVRPLQIVLLGQLELQTTLQEEALRPLQQAIRLRATIAPLTERESLAYIQHRLAQVMQPDAPCLFTPQALLHLVRAAQGIPRVMNVLGTQALLAGHNVQQNPISTSLMQHVIARQRGPRRHPRWQHALVASALLTVALSLFWLTPWQARQGPPPPEATPASSLALMASPQGPVQAPAPPPAPASQSEDFQASTAPARPPQASSLSERIPLTRLPRSPHEAEERHEALDTQAMQRLVTHLSQTDKDTPASRRAQAPPTSPTRRELAEPPRPEGTRRFKRPQKPAVSPPQVAPRSTLASRLRPVPPAVTPLPETTAFTWPWMGEEGNTQ